jgi:hypothetical protein
MCMKVLEVRDIYRHGELEVIPLGNGYHFRMYQTFAFIIFLFS